MISPLLATSSNNAGQTWGSHYTATEKVNSFPGNLLFPKKGLTGFITLLFILPYSVSPCFVDNRILSVLFSVCTFVNDTHFDGPGHNDSCQCRRISRFSRRKRNRKNKGRENMNPLCSLTCVTPERRSRDRRCKSELS